MKNIDFGSFSKNEDNKPHISTDKIAWKFKTNTQNPPVDFLIFFKFSDPVKKKIYRYWDEKSIHRYLTEIALLRSEQYGIWDILGCRNLESGEEFTFNK